MRQRTTLASVSAIAVGLALSPAFARAQGLDQQQLLLVDSAVASICTTVSTNGHVVNATLSGGIKARVTALFSRLLPIDADVKASISKTNWSGVAQADLPSVAAQNMVCRERVAEKLFALMAQQPGPSPPRSPPHHTVVLPVAAPGSDQARITESSAEARKAAQQNDFKAALQKWLSAAQLGSARAQFEAAQLYDYGAPGVPKDCVRATYWYKKAAASNLAAANYNVGGEYYYGCNGLFASNRSIALHWLQKAVNEGSPDAEYMIGMIYLNGGAGVTQNRTLARTWLVKAAAHGNPLAQTALNNIGNT